MEGIDSWPLMVATAVFLGLRHGFDLDHLATIDAITRTVSPQRFLSKIVGVLFSLGHGLVITLVSLLIGIGLFKAQAPEWLEGFGSGISIFFLMVFGLLNLWNVIYPETRLPAGLKSFLATRVMGQNPNFLMVVAIGALFAISFDTISQIALFSIAGSLAAGWFFSGILGLSFTFGMMLSDGLNGLVVSLLLQRADRTSLVVSRCFGLLISLFSLGTAAAGIAEIL